MAFVLLLNPLAKSRSVETTLFEAFSFIALARSLCGGVCGSLCGVCGVQRVVWCVLPGEQTDIRRRLVCV